MKHAVISIASVLMFLICGVVVAGCAYVIWGQRFVSADCVIFNGDCSFSAINGEISVGRSSGLPLPRERRNRMQANGASGWGVNWELDKYLAVRSGWQDFVVEGVAYRERFFSVAAPAWLLAAFACAVAILLVARMALLPLLRLVLAASRRSRNRCGSCSYNLKGNTSGVCPECGSAVPGKAGV